MFTTYVVVTLMAIAANTFAATADFFMRFKFVLICAAKVGVPESWLPAWHPQSSRRARITWSASSACRTVGMAAAVGLVLFFVVAIIAHLRVRDYSIGPAAAFLLLAVAALVLGPAS